MVTIVLELDGVKRVCRVNYSMAKAWRDENGDVPMEFDWYEANYDRYH